MTCRDAAIADFPGIQELLSRSKLPNDDFVAHIKNFIVYVENHNIVAVGGLEICGAFGLLRSIAVASEHRGKGIAKKIYELLKVRAHGLGINRLYLLTESSIEYFANLGFRIMDRADAPELIMETKQFKELCPLSATLMYCDILHGVKRY